MGSKMHDCFDVFFYEELAYSVHMMNVFCNQADITGNSSPVTAGKVIENDHRVSFFSQCPYGMTANIPGTTCNQYLQIRSYLSCNFFSRPLRKRLYTSTPG